MRCRGNFVPRWYTSIRSAEMLARRTESLGERSAPRSGSKTTGGSCDGLASQYCSLRWFLKMARRGRIVGNWEAGV